MANDLSNMTKKQLEKLLKDVNKALNNLKNKERKAARKAAEKAAQKFGFSLDELTDSGPSTRKSRKAPAKKGVAKFANPNDASQTWTGKGRQPTWYRDAIAAGTDSSDMEIR